MMSPNRAMLVLPRSAQAPLWVDNAEELVTIVWNGRASFSAVPRASFFPWEHAFYFAIRASGSVPGDWYVWAPEHCHDRIRINGQEIHPPLHLIRDADVISVWPRGEKLSISFFLPTPFLYKYTPKETLRCGFVNRMYACLPATSQINAPGKLAVKIVRVSRFADSSSFDNRIRRERAVVNSLMHKGSHPRIIQFYDAYIFSMSAYFVTERLDRCLDSILNERRRYNNNLTIREVRDYARDICSATLFLHSARIVVRNLSVKNIRLREDVPILSDFTTASFLPLDVDNVADSVNTADHVYLAPEVLQEVDQGEKVDCYSIGMVLKALLLGLPVKGGFHEHELRAANLSQSTINVVRRLLCANPGDRCSITDALEHPWFQE